MIQDIGPNKYHNEYYDKEPGERGIILIYRRDAGFPAPGRRRHC